MKALGSLGGKRRTSSVLGIDDSVAADLRPKAKAVLEEMLDSEDESKRLAAARSLYSYQAVRPVDQDRVCTCFTAPPGTYCRAVDEHGYRSVHRRGGLPTADLFAEFEQRSTSGRPLPSPGEIPRAGVGQRSDNALGCVSPLARISFGRTVLPAVTRARGLTRARCRLAPASPAL
jgi:hypothetical protein